MNKVEELNNLYKEIYSCQKCKKDVDSDKALITVQSLPVDLLVLTESLGPSTAKVTGVDFQRIDGSISTTGKRLESFLNTLGYTLYDNTYKHAYCSDIIKCYPKIKNLISIAKKCMSKGFLEREIEIIQPKVILLMGRISYDIMYSLIGCQTGVIEDEINRLLEGGSPYHFNGIPLIPMYHPSPANPYFVHMNTEKMIQLIKKYI